MMIQIIPYQSVWPLQFRRIGTQLKKAMDKWQAGVHHIGSTAVPGLAAKDIIDIQLSVDNFDAEMENELTRLGYLRNEHATDHRPEGRSDLNEAQLFKWFFQSKNPAVHLHVRRRGTFNERYPLLCRDYLRAHPNAAASYALIKKSLARRFPEDQHAYYEIKDPVFDVLMAGAEIWASTVNWSPVSSDI